MKTGTPHDLETAWRKALGATSSEAVLVDMSGAKYVDVPGMMYLLSRIVERFRAGHLTHIRLPVKNVVQHMRAWHFDSTLEKITSTAFEAFIDPPSLEDWKQYLTDEPEIDDELLPDRYYPLTALPRTEHDFGPSLAMRCSDHWQGPYILSVLRNILPIKGERHMATHVVHEAVMNSVRHPGAEVIVTGSSARRYASTGNQFLTICVWDDGESIASTLRTAVDEAGAVVLVPRQTAMWRRQIALTQVFGTKADKVEMLDNQQSLRADVSDGLLLLAATYPGVTKDQDAVRGHAHDAVVAEEPEFALPGMGLFVLCRTVAEAFGGKVTIRSDNLRLSIDAEGREKGSKVLHAKLTHLEDSERILGNCLTIRIPVKAGAGTPAAARA